MSRNQRIAILAGALALAVLAFVVLSPGDDDEEDAPTTAVTTVATTTAEPTTTEAAPSTTEEAEPTRPEPQRFTVTVSGGQPEGGVQDIEVDSGERVLIVVESDDTTDEVHLHGYDVTDDLAPGERARLRFTADLEGIYEIELEGAHVPIARLIVEP